MEHRNLFDRCLSLFFRFKLGCLAACIEGQKAVEVVGRFSTADDTIFMWTPYLSLTKPWDISLESLWNKFIDLGKSVYYF